MFSEADLSASLECSTDLRTIDRDPILLVNATTVTPQENYGWSYIPALIALNWPFCTVTTPNDGLSDIQEAAEYVVFAIREMHLRSGRKLQIVGHSQGGHAPRWALRWWPDTRGMVSEMVTFAAPHHGSVIISTMCVPGCAPAMWQQRADSNYARALNSERETYPEISYTNVYTHTDELVQPNLDDTGTSSLSGGSNVANVATQDICPGNTADHLMVGTSDAVAYALALDALSHEGPANPSRISISVCTEAFMPGVNPVTYPTDFANAAALAVTRLATYPHVPEEPPLKCYVTGSCE